MRVRIITAILMAVCCFASAQPRDLWSHSAGAPLKHDLLLGDFTKTIGYETVYTLDNPAKIVCLSPRGEAQWEIELEGNKSVTGLVAGSAMLSGTDALLAVGGDQDITCIYAESGKLYWRETMPGGLGAGGLMWIDLDGDFKEELVTGTAASGIIVRSYDGQELWRYTKSDHAQDLNIVGALAAGDINNDKSNDVIVPLKKSVLALDGVGTMMWESSEELDILGAPVIANCDGDAYQEIYILTQNPLGLLALDGDVGTKRWFMPLDKANFDIRGNHENILVVDLNQDGYGEIILCDGNSNLVVLGRDGKEVWRHTFPGEGARIGATDFDGDLKVELLVATSDGTLTQLGSGGELEWSQKRLDTISFAPVMLDINRDNVPDVLLVDSIGNVTCLRSNENYIPSLMLWPMARQNQTRDGQSKILNAWKTDEAEHLPLNGNFENVDSTGLLTGWEMTENEIGKWGLDGEHTRIGKSAIWLEAGETPITLRSLPLVLPVGIKNLSGSIHGWGAEMSQVSLQWFDSEGEQLREDNFSIQPPQEGWSFFKLNSTKAPEGAQTVTLVINSRGSGKSRVWWDAAQLEANKHQIPVVEILCNQVAYESYAPKKFVVRSNWKAKDAAFSIINEKGESLYQGKLTWGIRFKAGGEIEWPGYYWRGDFSEFYEQGAFRIFVDLDGVRVVSAPFEQGNISLWNKIAPITLKALSASLCGDHDKQMALRTELSGSTLRTAELFWELAQLRKVCRMRFEKLDEDKDGQDDLMQMLLGIGKSVAASIMEDGTCDLKEIYAPCDLDAPSGELGDSSVAAMGLARLAEQMEGIAPEQRQIYIDAAARALDWCLAHDMKGPMQFNAAVDLYLITKDAKYEILAKELLPKLDFSWVAAALLADAPEGAQAGNTIESVLQYESSLTTETLSMYQSVEASKAAETLINQAKNPFGVFMYGGDETLQCFPSIDSLEKASGHTRHILDAAAYVSQVYRFQPKIEYHNFVYDQLNWVMGCNPFGLCLLTGPGKRISPLYDFPKGLKDNRIAAGMLPRGPVAMGPGDDRPMFETSRAETDSIKPTNEVDLYNTVALLKVMANIKRMPVGGDDK